jgi:hypothetical protein
LAGNKTARTESEALRRELEALRAKPLNTSESTGETGAVDQPTHATGVSNDMNWDEVKHVIQEIGDELEQVAQKRPLVGMVGAFVLGVIIGRAVSR